MDALQGDIDTLEREKTELRERVKELSRKTLMEGIVRQSSAGEIVIIFITPAIHTLRNHKNYQVPFARTNRFKNSFLLYALRSFQ